MQEREADFHSRLVYALILEGGLNPLLGPGQDRAAQLDRKGVELLQSFHLQPALSQRRLTGHPEPLVPFSTTTQCVDVEASRDSLWTSTVIAG